MLRSCKQLASDCFACLARQLASECCSNGLASGSSFYILSSFRLYLLFMLLVLVNYTHMTCLYAGPDITKSIHRHQRCKRHTEKPTMHVPIALQASSTRRSHVSSSTCPRSRSEITISAFSPLSFFFLLCMAGQERHDLGEVSLRRRVKKTRWFVATTCCTGVIRFDVKMARLLMSELALKEEGTAKALVVIYKKPPHSKPVEAPLSEPATMASTFKACWGIPFGSQSDSEPATMAIPHSKPVEASFLRRSKRQWACYNGNVKHRLHHLGNHQS